MTHFKSFCADSPEFLDENKTVDVAEDSAADLSCKVTKLGKIHIMWSRKERKGGKEVWTQLKLCDFDRCVDLANGDHRLA